MRFIQEITATKLSARYYRFTCFEIINATVLYVGYQLLAISELYEFRAISGCGRSTRLQPRNRVTLHAEVISIPCSTIVSRFESDREILVREFLELM